MADIQTKNIMTNEYRTAKKSNMHKLTVVALLCLLCIGLLLLGLSRAKYRTPEMRGQGEYEAALFNTVLLGELTQTDIGKLTDLTTAEKQSYTLADGKTANITGRKLSSSLDLTVNNEIGHGNYTNLKPGDEMTIPFTVTNGTTVQGEGQEDATRNKVANVAESDIRYTLHIRTTKNLPLTYALVDLNQETQVPYELNETTYETETLGTATEYTVADSLDNVFVDGSRILKWTGDNSITVHRYALQINWDADGEVEIKDENDTVIETIKNTDTRYMKEIENIEVRLEVESYVNYASTPDTSDTISSGILTLKTSDVDSYYTVSDTSMGMIHSQKTVRYDNFGSSKVTAPAGIAGTPYVYEFSVQNGERTGANWVSDGEGSTEGHYEATGTFSSYNNLGVAIAVPIGGEAGVGSDMSTGVSYYIEYDGVIYTGSGGTATENESADKVLTDVWVKQEKTGVETSYPQYEYVMKDNVPAYRIIHFANVASPLTLSFENTFESKDLKLYMVDPNGKYSYQDVNKKDDFRIYIYSSASGSGSGE